MTDTVAQHPPAVKVGGRRLSISSRPKPHPPASNPASPTGEGAMDYPRPAAPGEQAPPHEDEAPKKEKKKGNGGEEHERRLQESLYRKAEENRPRKDLHNAKNWNAVGGGGRIGQPAGRGVGL